MMILERLAFVLGLSLMVCALARADETAGSARRGKIIYRRYCISCHGGLGNGAGDVAQWISPRPRDFRQGQFKWRSTPSGSLPLVSDLERTIREGLYGTNMPTWYPLTHRQRLDVIAYIQTFSDRWTKEKPGPFLVIPSEPYYSDASVTRGLALFKKMGCAACHGERGQGDGPSAQGLHDDWGNPILPYDLTEGRLKCGSTASDVYRVFMTGLNGTPMPSFKDALKPDEAWDLAHYIQSLSPNYKKNLPQRPEAQSADAGSRSSGDRVAGTIGARTHNRATPWPQQQ